MERWKLLDDFLSVVNEGLEIPIKNKEVDLGTIKISFKENKEIVESEKSVLFSVLLGLIMTARWIAKDMKIVIKTQAENKDRGNLIFDFARLYLPWMKAHEFYYDMWFKDDYIFDLIKAEGPIVLRNTNTQAKLKRWLADKDIASEKVNKLKDSLMEYAYSASFKDEFLRQGRPEIELLRKYGTEWIGDLYHDMTKALTIAKKKQKQESRGNPYEVIAQAFKDVVAPRKDKVIKRCKDYKLKPIELKIYNGWFNFPLVPFRLSEFIESDKILKTEFKSLRWEPNKFAKKIIAKLLDISLSKLEKILYTSSEF